MLKKGQLDAIIVALPFTEPDVEVRELYTEPLKSCCQKTIHGTKEPSIPPKQLQKMCCCWEKAIVSETRSLMHAQHYRDLHTTGTTWLPREAPLKPYAIWSPQG